MNAKRMVPAGGLGAIGRDHPDQMPSGRHPTTTTVPILYRFQTGTGIAKSATVAFCDGNDVAVPTGDDLSSLCGSYEQNSPEKTATLGASTRPRDRNWSDGAFDQKA
jgi:hypothetical protein